MPNYLQKITSFEYIETANNARYFKLEQSQQNGEHIVWGLKGKLNQGKMQGVLAKKVIFYLRVVKNSMVATAVVIESIFRISFQRKLNFYLSVVKNSLVATTVDRCWFTFKQ